MSGCMQTQTSGYVTCVEVMNAGNATGRYEQCHSRQQDITGYA